MKRISKFELISFTTGFALLAFELAAARILAPSIGSSTYVWTGVIGVIIAALSTGFLLGGRIADTRGKQTDVAWLLLAAGIFATATLVEHQDIIDWIVTIIADNRLQAVVAALLLFAPTSLLIGTTSPYLAKLKVTSLSSTGQTVALLDTYNAIGGILGTFITGFVLFGFIGAREAIGLVAFLLIGVSWLLAPRMRTGIRAGMSVVAIMIIALPAPSTAHAINIDTPSAHYKVVSGYIGAREVTGLVTGPSGIQSAIYRDGSRDLVFWYTQQMAELTLAEKPQSVLMLGGGAFTLAQYLGERLPSAKIDVVEIDPKLYDISKEHFNYRSPGNVTITFTDARTFVNTATSRYDVVLVDVYGDGSIPASLMTREYGQAVGELVNDGGMLAANIIGGQNGGRCQDVLTALDAAYRQKLPYAWYRNESGVPETRTNYVVAYKKHDAAPAGYAPLTTPQHAAYTDNFAPAERLFYDCQQAGR